MMGLNPEKKGVYSAEDVRYSRSFVTASERTQANIAVGKQRLQEMGFFGTLKQLAQKMLTLYNDGTFAWGKEGNFLQTVFDPPNTKSLPPQHLLPRRQPLLVFHNLRAIHLAHNLAAWRRRSVQQLQS